MTWILIFWLILGAIGAILIIQNDLNNGEDIIVGWMVLYVLSAVFGPLVLLFLFFKKGIHMKVIVRGKK